MQLLTILSLIYAAILVLVLAASLIAILYYLWRVRSVLSGIGEALGQVRQETEPLQPHLEQLHNAVALTATQVTRARDALGETGDDLIRRADRARGGAEAPDIA